MTLPRPTAQEERWLVLADRHPAFHEAAEARANGWKTASLLSRVLMFVLGLIAAGMITGSVIWMPGRFFVAGLAMVAAGEWLIRARRLVAGGIEEALILCGTVAIVGQVLSAVDGVGDATAALLFSLAVLAAGLRLGNALFTTGAALCTAVSLAFVGGGFAGGESAQTALAMVFCIAVAIAALAAGGRVWQRPSHDRMLDGLVIGMPLGAQAAALTIWSTPLRAATFGVEDAGALIPPLLALGFAATCAVVGLKRRAHAPLFGALLQLAFLAYELRELTGLPLHARMILWGAVLLAAGFALDRGLRRPRAGITSAPLGARSRLDDLVQVYGAAHVTPAVIATPTPGVESQGGSFGGGGASGRY